MAACVASAPITRGSAVRLGMRLLARACDGAETGTQASRAVLVSDAKAQDTHKKLSILCGLTLELSGRCRDKAQFTPWPTRSGPLERIVMAHC